ncbi:MAG: secondary thiamine-phosphate synthase enzyme YjbQ [Fibrobacterota bacterium]
MLKQFSINTGSREELKDITGIIEDFISGSGISDGICTVFIPHTTAAVTINENGDPSVKSDILNFLSKKIPVSDEFRHMEGNSDAHIKCSLFGASETLFFRKGRLVLGTWQSVYFSEFDGPRSRSFYVKLTGD